MLHFVLLWKMLSSVVINVVQRVPDDTITTETFQVHIYLTYRCDLHLCN